MRRTTDLRRTRLVAAAVALTTLAWILAAGCTLPAAPAAPIHASALGVPAGLPALVELGSDRCIPCKMMKPILADLKTEHRGSLAVVVIDVWKDRSPGDKAGIRVIPTQIFFDASGKELYRHEGFLAEEDILSKWKEFGVDLSKRPDQKSE